METSSPPRPRRSRLPVVLALAAVGVLVVFVALKVATLFKLGTPARVQATAAPAPPPIDEGGAAAGPLHRLWSAAGQGRVVDSGLLAGRGEVLFSEELAHRSWRVRALDARTGQFRWSNARENTAHVEAWAVTDAAVVLGYHHSASRLAWRLGRGASFMGVDPVSGRVRWQRTDLVLYGERPGDYAPFLAFASTVYGTTRQGVPVAVDTATGRTRWRHPPPAGCRNDGIVAGPAGVAMSTRCGSASSATIELLDSADGTRLWQRDVAEGGVRLLAVGTGAVAIAIGAGADETRTEVLGPGGSPATAVPCDQCGRSGPQAGLAGSMLVLTGGRAPLAGADASTGELRWRSPLPVAFTVTRLLFGGAAGVAAVAGPVAGGAAHLLRVDPVSGAQTEVTGFDASQANGIAGPYVLLQQPAAIEVYGP